jgi:hypothetical protein
VRNIRVADRSEWIVNQPPAAPRRRQSRVATWLATFVMLLLVPALVIPFGGAAVGAGVGSGVAGGSVTTARPVVAITCPALTAARAWSPAGVPAGTRRRTLKAPFLLAR